MRFTEAKLGPLDLHLVAESGDLPARASAAARAEFPQQLADLERDLAADPACVALAARLAKLQAAAADEEQALADAEQAIKTAVAERDRLLAAGESPRSATGTHAEATAARTAHAEALALVQASLHETEAKLQEARDAAHERLIDALASRTEQQPAPPDVPPAVAAWMLQVLTAQELATLARRHRYEVVEQQVARRQAREKAARDAERRQRGLGPPTLAPAEREQMELREREAQQEAQARRVDRVAQSVVGQSF